MQSYLNRIQSIPICIPEDNCGVLPKWFKICPFVDVGLFTLADLGVASPGFGIVRRKEIELNTRQPAVVQLANTSIALTGTFTNPEYAPVKESLLATLATELLSNEKTLIVKEEPAQADWIIRVNVTGYSAPHAQPYHVK